MAQASQEMTAADRFHSYVEIQTDGCWHWIGYRMKNGYGRFKPRSYVVVLAHRYSYEMTKGPIPYGFHIDHLCRVRYCVNPKHLEAVTCRENLLRGIGFSAENARKTHCVAGHTLSGENLIIDPKTQWRRCRICENACQRAKQARRQNSARRKGVEL